MVMVKTTLLLLGLLMTFAVTDVSGQKPEKVKIRQLDRSGVTQDWLQLPRAPKGWKHGFQTLVITDAEGLGDTFPDKASQEAIAKQVDFAKEKVLMFWWMGPSTDRLTPQVIDDGLLELHYRYGPDKGPPKEHFYLFAVPRGTKWKVVTEP
jgi:hypothetical protein